MGRGEASKGQAVAGIYRAGYALMFVITFLVIFLALNLLILGGILGWDGLDFETVVLLAIFGVWLLSPVLKWWWNRYGIQVWEWLGIPWWEKHGIRWYQSFLHWWQKVLKRQQDR